MSTESEIQFEVESLKERFGETKALYREVCALLFFRYGITPTASKLYQYVRKGSMSAPMEALDKFWDELRSKARVQIDHPDLPEALKVAAADAVQTIWRQSMDLARNELAVLHAQAQADSATALARIEAEREKAREAQALLQALGVRFDEVVAQLEESNRKLESERRYVPPDLSSG